MIGRTDERVPPLVFEDDNIVIGLLRFDADTCVAHLKILDKQNHTGMYYVNVLFESGDSVQLIYDAANQTSESKLRTAKSNRKNDNLKKIDVKRAN